MTDIRCSGIRNFCLQDFSGRQTGGPTALFNRHAQFTLCRAVDSTDLKYFVCHQFGLQRTCDGGVHQIIDLPGAGRNRSVVA